MARGHGATGPPDEGAGRKVGGVRRQSQGHKGLPALNWGAHVGRVCRVWALSSSGRRPTWNPGQENWTPGGQGREALDGCRWGAPPSDGAPAAEVPRHRRGGPLPSRSPLHTPPRGSHPVSTSLHSGVKTEREGLLPLGSPRVPVPGDNLPMTEAPSSRAGTGTCLEPRVQTSGTGPLGRGEQPGAQGPTSPGAPTQALGAGRRAQGASSGRLSADAAEHRPAPRPRQAARGAQGTWCPDQRVGG